MSETDTVTPPTEPASAVTAETEPKPEPATEPKAETDWRAAYVGLQTNLNRRDQRIEALLSQNQALFGALEQSVRSDVDAVVKQTLGEDGLKARQAERAVAQERQQALAAAQTAQQFIPAAIDVMASTMRAAGVGEQDIQAVFQAAKDTATVGEWSEVTKSGTAAAIAKARASETTKATAKNQEEITAEANALAERTLRTKGIDKVDLGRGQSRTPERSFIERLKAIDRNTDEGEKAYQQMRKDVAKGTLQI